ncbi:MAG: hypothetical protein NZZ41_08180 [Candidatus Dojkabacteria bacterium]|nr:hypothetical protein [Candidatus Dojkabacteria bacterium]
MQASEIKKKIQTAETLEDMYYLVSEIVPLRDVRLSDLGHFKKNLAINEIAMIVEHAVRRKKNNK